MSSKHPISVINRESSTALLLDCTYSSFRIGKKESKRNTANNSAKMPRPWYLHNAVYVTVISQMCKSNFEIIVYDPAQHLSTDLRIVCI